MKTSLMQFALLAFALGTIAGPIIPRCEDEITSLAVAATATTETKSTKTKETETSTITDSSEPTASVSEGIERTSSVDSLDPTSTTGDDSSVPTISTNSETSDPTAGASSVTGTSASATITSLPSEGNNSGGSIPVSSGTSALSSVQTIAAGESFDGGMVMFDRGVSCTGQTEGGDSDAVFVLENGASLSNAIIGPNQIEGVHCNGACTLSNVWWSAVCEDALSIKEQAAGETTNIKGGGAFGASDKVVQHNTSSGGGTVSITDFTVEDFGKLYRSCGNCVTMYERHVIMDGISATSGKELAGINSNFGDTAIITNSVAAEVDNICTQYKGTDNNDEEPSKIGSGADGTYCIYGSDVITN